MTTAALPDKARLSGALKKHFFLRVHMFVILGGTITVALLTTKILLITHDRSLALRYGIAVCVAFAAFLGFIKLWLAYVGVCAARSRSSSDWSDFVDFDCGGINVGGGGGGSSATDFVSGGGRFGGGGASGSWGEADAQVIAAPVKSGGGGFSLGDIDLGDDAGVIILIALLVLVIALAALWVIWAAPAILSEAAFQATLTAALARRAKKISCGSWAGSVFRATVIPFVIVLALAVTLGWYAQKRCPSATRLREVLECGGGAAAFHR